MCCVYFAMGIVIGITFESCHIKNICKTVIHMLPLCSVVCDQYETQVGTSLAAQWLRLYFTPWDAGVIPGQGTKTPTSPVQLPPPRKTTHCCLAGIPWWSRGYDCELPLQGARLVFSPWSARTATVWPKFFKQFEKQLSFTPVIVVMLIDKFYYCQIAKIYAYIQIVIRLKKIIFLTNPLGQQGKNRNE